MFAIAINGGRVTEHTEDDILINRFLAGEIQAFDSLYEKHYPQVFKIARGIVLDPDEAADACQEVFALVYKNLSKFDRRAKFSSWLHRVAVNRTIQYYRQNSKHRRNVELIVDVPAPEGHSPSDPAVSRALLQLSTDDRAIITLFYWEELSLDEIADALQCNPNAAKTRLHRARERFKQAWEKGI